MEYSPWAQTPCIMFVDHNAELRDYVKQILEPQGFKVLTARNSVDALVMATDYPRAIDVLLTETESRVHHNGMELAACFGILRPETRIVFTSAPERKSEIDSGREATEWETITKPFTKAQLVRAATRAADLDWHHAPSTI